VTKRPYVLLSCAVSVDGCLDAPGPDRLVLSGAEDLDRVDGERAGCDAIMVGAGTIRRDDPRLLIRSPARRAARAAQGVPEHPAGVTLTRSGELDPHAQFFTAARPGGGHGLPDGGGGEGGAPGDAREHGGDAAGPGGRSGDGCRRADGVRGGGGAGRGGSGGRPAAARLVYCASPAAGTLRDRLAGLAEVIDAGASPRLPAVLADLAQRGVRRLLVEGGAQLSGRFLSGDLVDELHLAVAPFFVGAPAAPRFAPPGSYPHGPARPMTLAGVHQLGQVVLLRYLTHPGGGR
jgi:5-amino-6-(5-phosphoribosylamino)uracil reductase